MRHYVTLFDRNYLVKGLCLIQSMQDHLANFRLHVLALDQETWDYFTHHLQSNIIVTQLEAIENHTLKDARGNRTWQEYCWLLASQWTLRCAEIQELGSVTYLDADAYFFSNPEPIFEEIGNVPFAIPPHRLAEKDRPRLSGNGTYNVCAVTFNKGGFPCLREWANYCLNWCYYRNAGGNFADQGIFDTLVPKYSGYAIENIGYDTAPWNGFQYQYRKDGESVYVSNGEREDRLCLYHFHEFLANDDGNVIRRTGWQLTDEMVEFIYQPYEKMVRKISRTIHASP